MKFLILSENSNGTWPHIFYRSVGAFELRKRIEDKGHTAEIIEFFTHWTLTDLKNIITNYFKAESKSVIAISTPFDPKDLIKIQELILWYKENFSNSTVIHGGGRVFQDHYSKLADIFFLGRSMEMFDAWLEEKDLTQYTVRKDPIVLINKNFNERVDNPVLPSFKDTDFLGKKDILGFEVGVGCRFNCTFCNYELRNAKTTYLLNPKDLREYFDIAYNKYGINNFFASDDTINETDDKLEIIAEAISGLNYHPNITAFARLDMINARKKQLQLFEQIKFKSLFFGIETFNQEASKLVRKKSGMDDNYQILKNIKEKCPDTFTVAGLIIGLYNDNEISIRTSLQKVVEEKLLNSVQIYPLVLSRAQTYFEPSFHSDMDLNPEKYGYKIRGMSGFHHGAKDVSTLNWQSDWIDVSDAEILANTLMDEFQNKINFINHLEYASYVALDAIKNSSVQNNKVLKNRSYSLSSQLKTKYIENRKKSLGL